ncbi:FAT4 [Branchiostoma lanceolatum]|uniref:FAT4 protein n=1 Tax=Branchiostoma lanceolatum TaxID=7740 RepID=A0A8J9ZRY6_BRALA|nr:FAT4 [Branchiostoma lanceolatum]
MRFQAICVVTFVLAATWCNCQTTSMSPTPTTWYTSTANSMTSTSVAAPKTTSAATISSSSSTGTASITTPIYSTPVAETTASETTTMAAETTGEATTTSPKYNVTTIPYVTINITVPTAVNVTSTNNSSTTTVPVTPSATSNITTAPTTSDVTTITIASTQPSTTHITNSTTHDITTEATAVLLTPDATTSNVSTTAPETSNTTETTTISTTPPETTTEPPTVVTTRSTTELTTEFTTEPENNTNIPTTTPETSILSTTTPETTTIPTTTPETTAISATTPETTNILTTEFTTEPEDTTSIPTTIPENTTIPTTTPKTTNIPTITPEPTTTPTTPETTNLPTPTPEITPIAPTTILTPTTTIPMTTPIPAFTPTTAPIPATTAITPTPVPAATTPTPTHANATTPTITPETTPIFTPAPETTSILTTHPAVVTTGPITMAEQTTVPVTTAAAGATTAPWRPTITDETTADMTTFVETTPLQSTLPYPEQTCPPDNSMTNITLWPVCMSRYFRFNATENTDSQLVGRIEGPTPADVEVLTSNFTINDDDDASLYFMLTNCSNSSCDIVTAQRLDRESKATFTFEVLWLREVYFIDTHVILEDCSSIPVEINIHDVNDNPPYFKPGAIAPFVMDQSPVGSIVAVLSADDADIGPNAAVTYSITPRSYSEYFVIDSGGVVTARRQVRQDELRQLGLLTDEDPELLFEVVASDGLFDTNTTVSFDVLKVSPDGPAINRSLPIEVTVLEEQPLGTLVINLRTNRPSDYHGVVYSFENTVTSFDLDSTSGQITTAEPLDRETKDSYYIVISASDPDSGIYFTSVVAEITVVVGDVNDNSPILSQSSYRGRVQEHADKGQLVTLDNIGITASDQDLGDNGRITFQLHCCHGLFQIDPETAEIRTADNSSLLDRENVAVYDLIVIARDNPINTTSYRESNATVTIDIVDINDNRPIFQNGSQLNISISEDERRGLSVATVTAADADSGTNGHVLYTINSGSDGKFAISPTSGVLSLVSELDREYKSAYSISIGASDGGNPSLTSEEAFVVHVTVLDVNDNEPEFLQSIYYITIDEESDTGRNIANITALDADEGLNARVTYTMFHCAPPFSIDSSTGAMYVQSRLDYDDTSLLRSYSCDISGTDGNYTSTALVQVEVEDINDNSPEFGAESGYSTQLLYNEGQALPAIVAAVDATDKDSGSNGDITFSIQNSSCDENVTADFTVDASTGIIRLLEIDVQDQSLPAWCNMTVVAADLGVPGLSSSTTVSVEITEPIGDTSKVTFGDSVFSGFVVENKNTVQNIVRIHATSVGKGCEAIRYKFASWQTDDFEFSINGITGDVSSRDVTFDREHKATYAFAVIAENNCTEDDKRFNYTSVIVHVNDTNDEQPTFSRPKYSMQVEEGKSGLLVGSVTAVDRDEGSNGAITYSIDGNDDEVFAIDNITASIMTKNALDRENMTRYQITVMAEDGGQPAQNSTAVVSIEVLDINDNQPLFDEPSHAVVVPEDLAKFSPLNVTVKATDKDHGLNGTVTYSLLGEGWQTFKIEEYTGTITLQKQLDYENITSYNLAVIAKDGGQPPQTSSIPLLINVTDVNDNEPVFERHDYNASVPRNVGTDVAVVNVNATDRDTGKNGAVWYNITGLFALKPAEREIETNLFQIDNVTGAIYVTEDFIKDTQSRQYALLVMALDMGNPSLNSITKASVDVSSTNLYTPEFRDVPEILPMDEDDGREPWQSRRIIEVRAVDNDTDSEGEVEFSLSPGLSSDLFTVGPTVDDQGFFRTEVWTKSPLDRERHPEGITLQVLAIDQGVTPKTSTATVHITLNDLNDNPPELHLPHEAVIVSQVSNGDYCQC